MLSTNRPTADEEERLDEVIAEFLRAEATGSEGDPADWFRQYPDCASGLAEFFADRQKVDHLMMPVRMEWPSSLKVALSGHLREGRRGSGVKVETVEFVPPANPHDSSRYRPLRFHARGGMGEIWLAEDERVGRQVAVKTLRSSRQDRAARFLVEAQVTGQLEHPSVVPLHDVGVDQKGNPFYVMKFIHGRRLSDAIADFHATRSAVDWLHDVSFRQLLSSFIDVCNAVAYAHSKGVLHRDIKPENVMLGAYGETLVVDWGLAKVIGQPDQPAQTSVRLSGGASTATQDGAIVGSPLYMSPEGAAGLIDEVDQSSDVYLLGATLYEILTGKPPRQGSSQSELIQLARETRAVEPRKLLRDIPRPLEAICLKAMAFRKLDRYATPLALANDIQRFLADESTAAYVDPWNVRLVRWARRHRRGLLRGVAAIGFVTLAGLALSALGQARALAEREQARRDFQTIQQLVDESQYFAANTQAAFERAPYYDLKRAEQAASAALRLAGQWGNDAERFPLAEQREELVRITRTLQLRSVQIQLANSHLHGDARKSLELLNQIKADGLAIHAHHELRRICLAKFGDNPHSSDDHTVAADDQPPWTAEDHFLYGELLRSSDVGSATAWLAEEDVRDRTSLQRALVEYRAALQLDPRHYWARFQLARCLLAIDRQDEAIEVLSACIGLRPTGPWAYSTRGLALARAGRFSEALADLDRALQLAPSFLPGRLNRGFVHMLHGNDAAAVADFDTVLAAPASERLNEALFYRATLRLRQQRDKEALSDLTDATQALPDASYLHWLQAQSLFRLGQYTNGQAVILRLVETRASESHNEKLAQQAFAAGKLLRKLATQLTDEPRREALARALHQLQSAKAGGENNPEVFQQIGAVHELLGQPTAAIEAYSKGLEEFSGNATLRNLRGWAYATSGQFDSAQNDFAAAIASQPQNAESHAGLGFVLAKSNQRDEARQEAAAAQLLGANNYLVLHNVACIYACLSATGEQQQECESLAIATLQHAIAQSRRISGGPDEITLIRKESAFPEALKVRPEFQQLVQ